eukprot:CAMPEP_0180400078 /NCGR_PEP_ID=MMETSP0989-20121125/37523_1 /TAXON_ID=697907 /ORGANISM="non described non described, Strain CCMP2293" /LENGTH=46 /DNA_ID= /DNA_START= /DNA_END= /DNA_ORIENTATION=
MSCSLLSRGVLSAAPLAAARSALQAARISTAITKVRASPLGAMRAP